jgi:hypothetical protein
VEHQIMDALCLDCRALIGRANVTDKRSAGYLKEETLVYLIRRAPRQGHTQLVSDLTAVLMRRCTPLIHRRLSSLRGEALADAYADVVATLFGRILELESDGGDFAQVRSWLTVCLIRGLGPQRRPASAHCLAWSRAWYRSNHSSERASDCR